ncbi:hypothetical protein [Corynebacterium sp. UBA2622]|uniref:hypothetical protein n=1 Tax=Corynebacterium sp. UBA2622 TaxID=1946393 RepID=UPI0025BCA2D5|nr:hypothetical protein [Corynebacterium sp. UBA2622]
MSNTASDPARNPAEDTNDERTEELSTAGPDGTLDDDDLVDEEIDESFPASDPPANY